MKARTLNIGSFDAAKAKEKYQDVMPVCKKEKCRGFGYTSEPVCTCSARKRSVPVRLAVSGLLILRL